MIASLACLVASGSQATTCFAPEPATVVTGPDLIFEGVLEEITGDQNVRVGRYRLVALYKGLVDGVHVTLEWSCGLIDSCPPIDRSLITGKRQFVSAYYREGRNLLSPSMCTNYALNQSGTAYLPALDRYRTALADAYRVAERDPNSLEAWDHVAKLQEANRDSLGALDSLSRLRALAPREQSYMIRVGDTLRALRRYADASTAYADATKAGPSNHRLKYGIVRTLIETRRFAEIDPSWSNYSDTRISKQSFAGRTLVGASFAQAELYECDLSGSNLVGADFSHAYLNRSRFSRAGLHKANFRKTQAGSSDFSDANLTDADLTAANFYGAELSNADLTKANLTDADFSKANLVGAKLHHVDLRRTKFIEADLSGADLSGFDLRRLEFQGAILRNARLVGANLSGAYLSGLPLPLRLTKDQASWKPADLRGADLTNAILDGADLRSAWFDCTTKFPEGFATDRLIAIESPECNNTKAKPE